MNKKRVYRWYRLEGLQIRMRVRRRKHMCLHRGPVPQAQRTHERWSMDFLHDQLFNGRAFRVLTVVDQFSRQTPLLEARFCFSGHEVAAALDRAIERAGTPASITVDHGTEFTSKALEDWAYQRGVKLEAWRIDHNAHRPHSSLGHLTPVEYARKRQEQRTWEGADLQS